MQLKQKVPRNNTKKANVKTTKKKVRKTQSRNVTTTATKKSMKRMQKRAMTTEAELPDTEQLREMLSAPVELNWEELRLADKLNDDQKKIIQNQANENIKLGAQLYFQARDDGVFNEGFTAHTAVPMPFLFRYLTNDGKSTGGEKPNWSSTIKIHYHVSLPDGTVLDDSGINEPGAAPLNVNLSNPEIANLGAVVSGFSLLAEGDCAQLIVPYFSQGTTTFHPKHPCAPLIYTILRVPDETEVGGAGAQPSVEEARSAGKAYLEDNVANNGYQMHAAGFAYKYLAPKQTGGVNPTREQTVKVHYEGKLVSGDIFDSSLQRGEPALFPLNRVVPGFSISISELMQKGDKLSVILPDNLAYGTQTIPISPQLAIHGGSTLQFDIELIDIVNDNKF